MRTTVAVGVLVLLSGCTSLATGNTVSGHGEADIQTVNASEVEREVHRMVNDKRRANGLDALDWNAKLDAVAAYHSEDMAQNTYMAHTAPDGETLADRLNRFGVECGVAGENLAKGYANADIETATGTVNLGTNETRIAAFIVNGWMHSPDHRKNILYENFSSEAIAVEVLQAPEGPPQTLYVTQNFC